MKKRNKVTMTDVATVAGVSQPTVSLVLSGKGTKVSEETKRMVLSTATELGYKTKKTQHSTEKPKKLALVVNILVDIDPFTSAINAVREAAWKNDYIVTIFNYCDDEELALQIEKEVLSGDYHGVIYASSVTTEITQFNQPNKLPTVFLNCEPKSKSPFPSIVPADKNGGYMATSYLIDQGYRRVALINGESYMIASMNRLAGYRQALLNHDLIVDESLITHADWNMKSAYYEAQKLLQLPRKPDAFFCASDYMAMGCYQAIKDMNLRIPDDVAVIGYDNLQIAHDSIPGLTTIQIPYYEMGKQAVDLLFDLINKRAIVTNIFKVDGPLIIRESV